VYDVFKWTGDTNFVTEMYTAVKDGMTWLLSPSNDPDGDLVADGQVQVESEALNMGPISTAVGTFHEPFLLTLKEINSGYNFQKILEFC